MNKVRIFLGALLLIMATTAPCFSEDVGNDGVDGHYCFGDGYFAYEHVRDWKSADGRALKIIHIGSMNKISEPREFSLKPVILRGMSCGPSELYIIGQDKVHIFYVGQKGRVNFLKEVPRRDVKIEGPISHGRIGDWVRLEEPLSTTNERGITLSLNAHGKDVRSDSNATLILGNKDDSNVATLTIFESGKFK